MATYFCEDIDATVASGSPFPGKRYDSSTGPESAANQFRQAFSIPVGHNIRVTLDGPNNVTFHLVEAGAPVIVSAPRPPTPPIGQ